MTIRDVLMRLKNAAERPCIDEGRIAEYTDVRNILACIQMEATKIELEIRK